MSVVGYGVAGLYTQERLVLILVVIVPVMLGLRLGGFLLKHMNEQLFPRAVISVIVATSLTVLVREAIRLVG